MKPNPEEAAKIGIREAMRLAKGHACGILESTEDAAFWGEDFFFDHEADWDVLCMAKKRVTERIDR
jgi:hypothetical protein